MSLKKLSNFLQDKKIEVLVVLIVFLMRMPFLGHDNFNTDVWKWKVRSYNFLNSVKNQDLSGTYQTYHPGYPLMILGSAGVLTYNYSYRLINKSDPPNIVDTIFGLHQTQKSMVVFAIALLLGISFFLLRKLTSLKIALLFLILLNTEPFFLSHTREFHLEGLMSAFMLVSVLSTLIFSQRLVENKAYKKYLLLASVAAALSVLTKSSALFVLPFNIFVLLFVLIKSNKRVLENWRILLKLGLLPIVFVFLLWPALWVSPMETISKYYAGIKEVGVEGEHIQLYFGNLVSDPGVAFYPLNVLIRFTPLLLLGVVGSIFLIVTKKNLRGHALFTVSLTFVLLYLIYLSIPTKKLDRYIVPIFPFAVIVASLAFFEVLGKIKQNLLISLITVIFIARVFLIVYLTPNYLFYYSPLVGGANKGMYMVEPKWAFAGSELGAYFKTLEKGNVALPEKYFSQLWPFIPYKSEIMDIKKDADKATYFVFPVWDDRSSSQGRDFIKLEPVKFKGVNIYNVYKITPIEK